VIDDDGFVKANLTNPAQDRKPLSEAFAAAKREIEKVEKARTEFEAKKKAAQEAEAKKKAEEEAAKKQQGGAPSGAPAPNPNAPPQPSSPAPGGPKQGEPPAPPKPEEKPGEKPPEKPADKKEEVFQPPPIAPPLQPFVDLIQKKAGSALFVKLGGASTYLHYLEATKDLEFAHVLYPEVTRAAGRPQAFSGVSGTDLHWIADKLGESKELVVLAPYLSYSQGSVDFVNVPKVLTKAGARVALTPMNDGADEWANWRFNLQELIEGGLARADAITAISKHAAEAVGAADRLGTLETGKDANVVVLTADPFDVQAVVDRVVIEGKVVWTRAKKGRS